MTRWLVLFGMSGCAFALTGPEATPAHTAPRCDSGKGRVVADGLIASGLAVATVASAGGSNNVGAVVPALAGLAFIGSALKGNAIVERCRKAQGAFAAEAGMMLSAEPTRMPMPAALARVPAQLEPTKPEPAQAEPAKREPAQPEFAKPEPAKVAAPPADPWRAFWKVMP